MAQFLGVLQHEFGMSIRRKGLWVAFGLLIVFYGVILFTPVKGSGWEVIPPNKVWQYSGQYVYVFNMFFPLLAGILAADRMQRDFRLGMRELQISSPLNRVTYILGKYFGVLFSVLLPIFLWVVVAGLLIVVTHLGPASIFGAMLVVFLTITVPAFAFVVAFSLACPLVMPVRVYQVLFTGYWFWGNYLNPQAFPTLNGTLLTPGGMYAFQGFFGGWPQSGISTIYTSSDAILNLLVLALCILAVLFATDRLLIWQARRA